MEISLVGREVDTQDMKGKVEHNCTSRNIEL